MDVLQHAGAHLMFEISGEMGWGHAHLLRDAVDREVLIGKIFPDDLHDPVNRADLIFFCLILNLFVDKFKPYFLVALMNCLQALAALA